MLSLVWLGGIGSVLGVVFGHLALSRAGAKRRGDCRTLAIGGLVLGYLGLILIAIIVIVGVRHSSDTCGACNSGRSGTSATGPLTVPTDPGAQSTPAIPPARIELSWIGQAITNYYAAGTSPLTLTEAGGRWLLTDSAGNTVKFGDLPPDTAVADTAIVGPSHWCVALARISSPGTGWMDTAQGGITDGTSCPETGTHA